jgi:aspartate 1-decarboxylase
MNITLLKAKIHRAVVTQADLDYVGSITIDSGLLRESGILEYEKVEIADIDNGSRFVTYAIAGEEGSGIICLNGAAAKCVNVGDKVIIMAYANMTPEEAKTHKPTVIFVNDHNQIVRKANYEKHGLLKEQ